MIEDKDEEGTEAPPVIFNNYHTKKKKVKKEC